MTNTKFRKRALLSSVAMLLVAILALGSATFAWFSSSKNANATGVKMTTTAQSGILVLADGAKSKGDDFAMTTTLGYINKGTQAEPNWSASEDFVLAPFTFDPTASITAGSDPVFYTTQSTDPALSKAGKNVVTTGTPTYKEKVFVKSTAGTVPVWLTGVTINYATTTTGGVATVNNANVAAAVRVLVVDDQGKILAYVGGSGATANTYLTDEATAADGRESVVSTGNYSFIPTAAASVGNTANKLTNDVTTGDTAYVTVYAFLDGEDQYVTTKGVSAQDIISSIDLQFSIL